MICGDDVFPKGEEGVGVSLGLPFSWPGMVKIPSFLGLWILSMKSAQLVAEVIYRTREISLQKGDNNGEQNLQLYFMDSFLSSS